MRQEEAALPGKASSVRVIAGDVWCCCGAAGIIVFGDDLKQIHAINIAPLAEGVDDVAVYDVAMMTHGELVVATSDGLYHTDLQGMCMDSQAVVIFISSAYF